MSIRAIVPGLIALFLASGAMGYEVATHERLSSLAVEKSNLARNTAGLVALGIDSPSTTFTGSDGIPRPISDLIQKGARDEDNGLRPINHFYDPYRGRALTVPLAYASPDWALEDQGAISGGVQEFSYRHALDYFQFALKAPTKQTRDQNWGKLFESLGHVIHHVQDMAQPQHVRNDAHLDKAVIGDRSLYESCTNTAIANPLDPSGCGSPLAVPEYGSVTFPWGRDFWTTLQSGGDSYGRGRGMADFTNRNFVSKDTNFQLKNGQAAVNDNSDYPLPMPAGFHAKTLEELGAPNAAETCERLKNNPRARGVPNAKCEIEFYATDIYDAYTATSSTNDRASSLSIFDQYLELRENFQGYKTDRLFTLNRFNYAAAHPFLISRAVAYSAGLINHFFRGRMELGSADAEDGQIRIEIKNTSEAGNAFGPGTFTMYYDSSGGTRKALAIETGSDLGAGQFPSGATHALVIEPPEDLDMKAVNPFVLVYKGIIGAEEAVSGLVLDAPDAYQGFFFNVNTSDISDRIEGPRLIYKKGGQWKLHPQGNLPVGGAVDWKGWYKNGKPTRILTWAGNRRNRYGVGNYSAGIKRGGKLFAAAPFPVLGAALQKDAEGKEWVLAICEGADKDIVFKRPAKRSSSAALYDPNSAPEGWRKIGEFSNPPDLSSFRRPWLFNGDGTEAQTMRERKRASSFDRKPFTRLKIITSGFSAQMSDLGNTQVIERVDASRNLDDCPGDPGSASGQYKRTISGENIVAVDYLDNQEVFARIFVESVRVGNGTATTYVAQNNVYFSGTGTVSEDSKWVLQMGDTKREILRKTEASTSNYSSDVGRLAVDSKAEIAHESMEVREMDLRTGLLIMRTTHLDSDTEYSFQSTSGPVTGSGTHNQHGYQEYSADARGLSENFGRADQFETRQALTQDTSLWETVRYTLGHLCAYNNEIGEDSYSRSNESKFLASFETLERVPVLGGPFAASAATDRDGNVFMSLLIRGGENGNRFENFLTGADPVAVIGALTSEADRYETIFSSIGPK